MTDFKPIGGNEKSWGDVNTASARVSDVSQQKSEYKIGGKFGGRDIRIRTGGRVTRARGAGVWTRRLFSGIRDKFVRENDIGIIKKSSQKDIERKLARNLRHSEHAFDKSVNRLVEDLANFGETMTEPELANHLVNIRNKMVELRAAGKAAGNDRSEPEHLMERLRNTLVDSLTVVATVQPEKANVIRRMFEPGGRLASVGKNFGMIVPQEDMATKSDGRFFFSALKEAVSGAIGRKDDLSSLYQNGVKSMNDLELSHTLQERDYPTLAKELLAFAVKEQTGNNVYADRLLSRIYAPKSDFAGIKVDEQPNRSPTALQVNKHNKQQLLSDLKQFRDEYLDKNSPNTLNVSGTYRQRAISEINRYLDGNGDLQKLVNALDAVKVDNQNRMSDTFGRFRPQLEPKWGRPAPISGKQVGGPDNLMLSGPSDVGLEHHTTLILNDITTLTVKDGLSKDFIGDVERKSMPVLVEMNGKQTTLQPEEIGNVDPYQQFKDFVDHSNPNVAKNLSQYVNQNAVKNSLSFIQTKMRDRAGDIVVPFIAQHFSYTVQKDGKDGFFVKYNPKPGINMLVGTGKNNNQLRLQLDEEQNYLQFSMTIHLTTKDLAEGNGNFTYVEKPTWSMKWQDQPTKPVN